MTKKDYILIAEIINSIGYPSERERIAKEFANRLQKENTAFNRDIFLKACTKSN